jgi:hypothetical protein
MDNVSNALTDLRLLGKAALQRYRTAVLIALMDYNVYNAILDTHFTMAIAILQYQTAQPSTHLLSFAVDAIRDITWFCKMEFTHVYYSLIIA